MKNGASKNNYIKFVYESNAHCILTLYEYVFAYTPVYSEQSKCV